MTLIAALQGKDGLVMASDSRGQLVTLGVLPQSMMFKTNYSS